MSNTFFIILETQTRPAWKRQDRNGFNWEAKLHLTLMLLQALISCNLAYIRQWNHMLLLLEF